MSVLYLLIPLSIVIAAVALGAFLWAVHRGQFDDLDGPAYRAVLDDEPTNTDTTRKSHQDPKPDSHKPQ